MHLQDTVAPLATSRPPTKLGAHFAPDTWEYGLQAGALCFGLRPQFSAYGFDSGLLSTAELLGNLGGRLAISGKA